MKKAMFLVLFAFLAMPAQAATVTDLYYKISFLGLGIGDIHYRIVMDGEKYTLTFDGGFGGLGSLFANADGKATTTGSIRNGRIIPARVEQVTHWGEKERIVYTNFSPESNVIDYGATPRFDPQGRVPVADDMLKDVRDTQSALVLPVLPGQDVCDQTVRVFDGRERYDLIYTPTSKPLHCRVKPVRVGGHKVGDETPEPFKTTLKVIDVGGVQIAVPEKTVKPYNVGTAIITLSKLSQKQM